MSYFIDLSLFRHNRNFTLLYVGQFVSFAGTMITGVAVPYQIYSQTHSTLMVGLLSLAQLIPLLGTALLGGALADRHSRRQLLLITESIMALGCLLLAWNASLPHPTIILIFVGAVTVSALSGLHRPALGSILQQIVAKEDFVKVGPLSAFQYSVCMIAGPAAAGLIISHFGIITTFLVDFASFIISLLAIALISHIPKPERVDTDSTLQSLKSGMKYAAGRQELCGSYLVDFVAMIFGMPNALFPAIAHSFGGVKTLGMLYAAPAVGALVISLLSGWLKAIKRHGAGIAVAATLWGVAIIGFGLAHHLWLALFFLALAGAFDTVSAIFRSTLWNETIPEYLRGRLAGIEMISYLSGPKLGDTEAGLVAAAFGVTASVVSGGVLCVIGVVTSCYFLPKFWQYRSQPHSL